MSGGMAGAMGGFPMMGGIAGAMGGYPMSGGMAGLAGGLGGMDGGLGSMQMQQQMAQMQMQQYQVWMEQQRRVQENTMARQRVVSGLQTELYSLLHRLQQAQYGVGVDMGMGNYGGVNNGGYGNLPMGSPYQQGTPGMPGGTVPTVR
jgi:hypothetical protein